MKYKTLGNSGLRVSELALGTMTFGMEGWGSSKEESRRMFDAYVKAGGNFIDAANMYANGESEAYIGEFIKGQRERFALATKYVFSMDMSNPNASGSHRKNMMESVEASLKRLQTDYIDLLWVHAYDPYTPVEEVMRGLDDLIAQGKVLYIGISDAPAWHVAQANTLALLRGWNAFIGMQMEYSLAQRTGERELLPMAEEFNLGVTAWSPLASGLLTGKYSNGSSEDKRLEVAPFISLNEKNLAIADKVMEVAKKLEISPAQVALKWIMNKSDRIIPIIGARKLSQLQDNLKVLDVEIPQQAIDELEEISKIELGFPHDFIQSESTLSLLTGNVSLSKMQGGR